jgi:membrane associated rhomboid family serine protease
VVKNLIIINVLFFLATYVSGRTFGLDLTSKLALFYPASDNFRPYQFITHMFMHGNLTHIFFNMFALWMFGRVLENVWGGKRFFTYYFITGLGAAFLHTLVLYIEYASLQNAVEAFTASPTPEAYSAFIDKFISKPNPRVYDFIASWQSATSNPEYASSAISAVQGYYEQIINIPTVGASGAVFGVLLGFGMLFPNTQLMLLFPPIPIRAKYFVIFYGVLELFLAFTQPGSNIAHFAHLGGMLFGFILIKYWNKNKKTFF